MRPDVAMMFREWGAWIVERPSDQKWCILRCSARNTLPLAASLGAAGFEVWTPVEVQDRRLRRAGQQVERSVPIAPTFVFARARHIADLFRARSLPASPHAGFSIFTHDGRAPLISEASMAGLRAEEGRARAMRERAQRAKRTPPTYSPGASVKVDQPAFAGLGGKVERQNGRDVLVCFGGHWRVKIDAWLVLPDALQPGQSVVDAAA